MNDTAEQQRLIAANEDRVDWKKWGPYLSERAWGTVREDYSAYGTAWDYFTHNQARSRAYRWNEDGLAGIRDRSQYLCFALALWNGRDPILKERLFGLGGPEGNHGEDVKEYYFYLELARENPVNEDMATKFLEHFLSIANAMSHGFAGQGLWDEADGFFYDVLHLPDDSLLPLKVRSLVGLIPLIAVETLEHDLLAAMPDFRRRLHWFITNRPHLAGNMLCTIEDEPHEQMHILGIVTPERLVRVLKTMLDEKEFLSPHGIRSLSKVHETPYMIAVGGETFSIKYQPAESESGLFGGNSNWRGPVWFPINFLLIEALQRYHHYYGDTLTVEFPSGSGKRLNLWEVSAALSQRMIKMFLRDEAGRRPIYGGVETMQNNPHWRDMILFHEYFHGDNGAGLGASHQTGWTGLVAKLIQQSGGQHFS